MTDILKSPEYARLGAALDYPSNTRAPSGPHTEVRCADLFWLMEQVAKPAELTGMTLVEAKRLASATMAELGDDWAGCGRKARSFSQLYPAFRFTRSAMDGGTYIYVNVAGSPFTSHEEAHYVGPDRNPAKGTQA